MNTAFSKTEEKVDIPTVYLNFTNNIPKFRRVDFSIGRVVPADRNIANGLIPPGQKVPSLIHFIPKTPGLTSITVYDTKNNPRIVYQITVLSKDQGAIISELNQLLGEVEGIQISPVGTKVAIGGEIILPRDLRKIISVIGQVDKDKDYKGKIILTAALSDLSKQLIANMIMREISENEALKSVAAKVYVKPIKNNFQLVGIVDTDDQRKKIETIAFEFIPDFYREPSQFKEFEIQMPLPRIVNLIDLAPEKKEAPKAPTLYKITARYVEMNKNYLRQFGIDWGPGFVDTSKLEVDSEKVGVIGAVTGTINSLIPKLKTAKELGLARELQAFEILITEGENGIISNVTNIPFPVIGERGQEGTEFAPTGLDAVVKPNAIGDKANNVKLALKFSLKTLAGFVNARPSITENKMDTTITLKPDQSAAIGGLVTASLGKEFNRMPKATQEISDPIFRLLRSKAFRDNKSQFVIFVTPQIMTDVKVNAEASTVGDKFNIKLPEAIKDDPGLTEN
ncbi:MAG: hypothetical protein HYW47_05985 [Deltaproteobacteria bacterium]|nr:hypothetical protein [Deltaproteobacteria bacterium]